MPTELTEQGVNHLAMAVGESTQGTAFTRILALKSSPGWMVADGSVAEWRFDGVTEREGIVYLIGPFMSGITMETVLAMPLATAMPFVGRLASALHALDRAEIPWFPLEAGAVLFAQTGGVLFLPPRICAEIRDIRPFASHRDTFESLNHPDLSGEALASFSVASVLYRLVTGRFAFTGSDAEEIHERARKLDVTPPAQITPALLPEVSALIMDGLGRGRRGTVALAEWETALASWGGRDLFRVLSTEEREKIERAGTAHAEGSAKSFRRRVFWEKNWKLVLVIAVVVAAVGAIGGSIVRNVTAPRITRGFSPDKVVTTFYLGMNSLDHSAMEACVVNKAGQGEVNEATTLFVTSRVTMGYEGKSNVVSAGEWDAQGRPALVSPATLYGVTKLALTQEQPAPAPVFLVKYEKWNPAQPPDTDKAPSLDSVTQSEGHQVMDRVWMKQDKGDWVIYKIDRLQFDPLQGPITTAAPSGATILGQHAAP